MNNLFLEIEIQLNFYNRVVHFDICERSTISVVAANMLHANTLLRRNKELFHFDFLLDLFQKCFLEVCLILVFFLYNSKSLGLFCSGTRNNPLHLVSAYGPHQQLFDSLHEEYSSMFVFFLLL